MADKALHCHICEVCPDVKWYCESCNLNVCDVCCTNIHSKIQSLKEHIIHDIASSEKSALGSDKKVRLNQIHCSSHGDKTCLVFCQNCDKSLCSSCVIQSHQHDELAKLYDVRRNKLVNLKEELDISYECFHDKAEKYKDVDSTLYKQHTEISEKIEGRKQKLNDEVIAEAKTLMNDLNDIWNPEDNDITKRKNDLIAIEEDLSKQIRRIDTALSAISPAEVFAVAEQVGFDVPAEPTENTLKAPKFAYIPNDRLGSVVRVPVLENILSFTIKLPDISGITSLDNDLCVLYSKKYQRFQHFVISDNTYVPALSYGNSYLVDISTKTIAIAGLNGKILLADFCDKIKCFENGKGSSVFHEIKSTTICGLFASDTEIFIGYKTSALSGICMLNKIDGSFSGYWNTVRKFEFSSTVDRKLLCYPAKIAVNINKDICIVNYENYELQIGRESRYKPRKGNVVVLSEWGAPQWTYDGHPSINNEEIVFTPHDIVTTSCGYVIVADRDSHSIHVLSINGQFITNCAEDLEIEYPTSLNLDKKGRLMIGCFREWEIYKQFGHDRVQSETSALYVADLIL